MILDEWRTAIPKEKIPSIQHQNYWTNRINGGRGGSLDYSLLDCAMTYLNNNDKLYYGNDNTIACVVWDDANGKWTFPTQPDSTYTISGKNPIDCQSFISMCLRGIGYEESCFGNGSLISKYPVVPIPWLDDDFMNYRIFSASDNIEESRLTHPTDNTWCRVLTWQFLKYWQAMGCAYKINSATEIQPGDLVYTFSNGEIHHVSMSLGKYHDSTQFLGIDCTSEDANNPIRIRLISVPSISGAWVVRLPAVAYKRYENLIANIDHPGISPVAGNDKCVYIKRNLSENDTYLVGITCTVPESYATGVWVGVGQYPTPPRSATATGGNLINRLFLDGPGKHIVEIAMPCSTNVSAAYDTTVNVPNIAVRFSTNGGSSAASTYCFDIPFTVDYVYGAYTNDITNPFDIESSVEESDTTFDTEFENAIYNIATTKLTNRTRINGISRVPYTDTDGYTRYSNGTYTLCSISTTKIVCKRYGYMYRKLYVYDGASWTVTNLSDAQLV